MNTLKILVVIVFSSVNGDLEDTLTNIDDFTQRKNSSTRWFTEITESTKIIKK
jgi:hypothetical protein